MAQIERRLRRHVAPRSRARGRRRRRGDEPGAVLHRQVVARIRQRRRTTRATSRRARSTSPTSASSQVAWTYPFGDTGSSPIVVRGVIYGRGRNGSLVAVDAKTGKELWVRENMNGMTSRGINYWESADGRDQRLIFAMNSLLQEVDAKTGKSIMTFGTNGVVDLRVGHRRPRSGDHRQHPVEHARRGLREPDHPRQRDRRRLHVAARRHPRLRRPHRQAGVDVPHRAASRRVRLRHLAEGRLEVHRRRQQLGRDDDRHRSAASPTFRSARRPTTSTAPTASAPTSSARRSSRSTRAPASACGTSRSCTTISGTSTRARRRS